MTALAWTWERECCLLPTAGEARGARACHARRPAPPNSALLQHRMAIMRNVWRGLSINPGCTQQNRKHNFENRHKWHFKTTTKTGRLTFSIHTCIQCTRIKSNPRLSLQFLSYFLKTSLSQPNWLFFFFWYQLSPFGARMCVSVGPA